MNTIVPCQSQNYPRHTGFVNKPVVNYAQMMIVFTTRFVSKQQLPHLLIKAMNYIVDNDVECAEYHRLLPGERRVWLRTWLHKQFP